MTFEEIQKARNIIAEAVANLSLHYNDGKIGDFIRIARVEWPKALDEVEELYGGEEDAIRRRWQTSHRRKPKCSPCLARRELSDRRRGNLPRTIWKIKAANRHQARRWREALQFILIMLVLGAIIAGIGGLQYFASKLP